MDRIREEKVPNALKRKALRRAVGPCEKTLALTQRPHRHEAQPQRYTVSSQRIPNSASGLDVHVNNIYTWRKFFVNIMRSND